MADDDPGIDPEHGERDQASHGEAVDLERQQRGRNRQRREYRAGEIDAAQPGSVPPGPFIRLLSDREPSWRSKIRASRDALAAIGA